MQLYDANGSLGDKNRTRDSQDLTLYFPLEQFASIHSFRVCGYFIEQNYHE